MALGQWRRLAVACWRGGRSAATSAAPQRCGAAASSRADLYRGGGALASAAAAAVAAGAAGAGVLQCRGTGSSEEAAGVPPAHPWSDAALRAISAVEQELRGADEPELWVHCRPECRPQNALNCAALSDPDNPMIDYHLSVSVPKRVMRGVVYLSRYAEGPRGAAHGGMLAAVIDQAMGVLAAKVFANGCVTLALNISYKKFVPSGSELLLEAWVERSEGRKHWVKCQLKSLDGQVVHTEGTGLWLQMRNKQ